MHPELFSDIRLALWSLNDIARGGKGIDIPRPDDEYITETLEMLRLSR